MQVFQYYSINNMFGGCMKPNYDEIESRIRQNQCPVIGAGSGRRVFDLGNGYVVKVARNRKGVAQNYTEKDISIRDRSGLFADILDISEDGKFLIMEKAELITDMRIVWNYFAVKNNHELSRKKEIKELYVKYYLLIPDLFRSINWGMINGKPVIIDYGFTRAVRQRYYSIF